MLNGTQTAPERWSSAMPVRTPRGLIERWNWKAALFSAMTRAPIFLMTTYAYGWHRVTFAVAIETAYRAGTSGVFAGIIQRVRNWRPIWLAALLITVAVPALSQTLDYALHFLMRTPNLRVATLVSLAFTEIASLFNWYSMQRGSFLVGSEQKSLLHDLCSLPRLIAGFGLAPAFWMWRGMQQCFTAPAAGDES